MATLTVFSKDGKKSGTLAIPKLLSESKPQQDLLHHVVTGLLANLRRSTAHTKTRGEVSGGGRKPWRQKGTGRARAGSTRSPLWRGGGATFGPRNTRNWQVDIPPSMRSVAFRQVLAQKIRDGEVFLVTAFEVAKPKTKLVEEQLQKLPLKEGTVLLIIHEPSETLRRATNNISYLTVKTWNNVNLLDLLRADSVIATKETFGLLEQRYDA